MEIMTTLENLQSQLESSWASTFEKILKDFKHEGKDFYIFTFTKINRHVDPPQYTVYHQPRFSRPDAILGTSLRKVFPSKGLIEIVWALPHQEGLELYKSGKAFEDKFVASCIEKFFKGELDLAEEGVATSPELSKAFKKV